MPVKAYTASDGGSSGIRLNQLHETCHSRIKYQKTCPLHGPVDNDEIVSGYEFAKDQYVVIDPSYHSGKTYYLVPESAVGQKPYRLIRQSLEEEQLQAIGEAVISNRERLSALVNAKVEGEKLVSAPDVEEPTVINLMDALKASIQQIPVPEKTKRKPQRAEKTESKPKRKVASSATKRAPKRTPKRKTG